MATFRPLFSGSFPLLLLIGLLGGLPLPVLAAEPTLENGFQHPPREARPLTWWHWMDGNVSQEGITADLESMRRVGLAGADIFIGDADMPAGPALFLSDRWFEMVRHSAQDADRLGLELGIHNCAGWSSSGGPWNTPENSMKEVVSAEVRLHGPQHFDATLPRPTATLGFYRDIALQAFPATKGEKVRMADFSPFATVSTVRGELEDASQLIDGREDTAVLIPTPNPKKPPFIQIAFEQAFSARDLTIVPGQGMEGVTGEVRISNDGADFHLLMPFSLPVGAAKQIFSFPLTSARFFRIVFTGRNPRTKQVSIAEVGLSQQLAIANLGGKAFYDRKGDYREDEKPTVDADQVVSSRAMVDLTGRMSSTGKLTWDVPPGDWVILRTGFTSIGVKNHPAPIEGTGLECDKLSIVAVDAHWQGMMAKVIQKLGPLVPKVLNSVVVDSYEVSTQNWTDDFRQEFQKRRGYDPVRFLPVFSGRIVDNPEISDRFLWDLRRTVADLFAQNYAGHLAQLAENNGMRLSLEPYGNSPSDDLQYGAVVHVPMTEFWVAKGLDGCTELAASIGHTNGKQIIGSESFTAGELGGNKWDTDPFALKGLGDLIFAAGINRFSLHEYTQQPFLNRAPGLTLGGVGTQFGRLNTWWEQGRDWVQYLSRCQWMLQQGKPVVDVCDFVGEDVPLAKYGGSLKLPGLPEGFRFDACSADVLLDRLSVKDGRLVLPDGMSYRLLVLPKQETMTLRVIRKLQQLVDEGAVIVGPKPLRTPGLEGYPESEMELGRIASRLWGANQNGNAAIVNAPVAEAVRKAGLTPDFEVAGEGAHLVYAHRRSAETEIYFVSSQSAASSKSLASFRVDGKTPEFWHPDTGVVEQAPVFRSGEGRTAVPLHLDPFGSVFVVFRQVATREHLVSLQADENVADGESHLPATVSVNANGTYRLITGAAGQYRMAASSGKSVLVAVEKVQPPLTVTGSWTVSFPPKLGAPPTAVLPNLISWTENADAGVKYFSGTATYEKSIDLPTQYFDPSRVLYLDLGAVKNIAEVELNGRSLGILWKPPFRLDVSQWARSGPNALRIHITNLWPNRLIGDERLPDDHRWNGPKISVWPDWFQKDSPSPTGRITFATHRHWSADAPLLTSGLLGPVRFESLEMRTFSP